MQRVIRWPRDGNGGQLSRFKDFLRVLQGHPVRRRSTRSWISDTAQYIRLHGRHGELLTFAKRVRYP